MRVGAWLLVSQQGFELVPNWRIDWRLIEDCPRKKSVTNEHKLSHLRQLEAESIQIIREAAAEFDNPVMMYSVGKDSSVMLRLAEKAFAPGALPFPLLHVDTTWKFQDMYRYRDKIEANLKGELIKYTNQEGAAMGMNPFDFGSKKYTDIMKTEALK